MGFFSIFKAKQNNVNVPIEDISIALLNTFEVYHKRLTEELLQTQVANKNIQAEVAIFLYAIVDISAKIFSVNHVAASNLIYEHTIKNIKAETSLDSFAVFKRTNLYMEVFLEPDKAKGLWMASSQKFTNPFAACMVAFGDVLTNPQCVEEIGTYYENFPLNIYGLLDSIDFQSKFMKSFDTYQEYISSVAKLIEQMEKCAKP